jgi:cell division septation protein DedD
MHMRKQWHTAAATALLLITLFVMTACAPGPLGELTLPGAGSTATGTPTPAQPAVKTLTGIPVASFDVAPPMGFWAVWGPKFRTKADADSVVARLATRGFPSGLVYTPEWEDLDISPWYAVYIGPYSSKEKAAKAMAVAQSAGYAGLSVKYTGPTASDVGAGYTMSGVPRHQVSP